MALSKRFRRYRGWIALALLVTIASAGYAAYAGSREPAATTTYTTETAEEGTGAAILLLGVLGGGALNLETPFVELIPEMHAEDLATVVSCRNDGHVGENPRPREEGPVRVELDGDLRRVDPSAIRSLPAPIRQPVDLSVCLNEDP